MRYPRIIDLLKEADSALTDEARREFEVVQRRGQGPVCLAAFQHLGVAVGNDHRHLQATEVIYELVENRS